MGSTGAVWRSILAAVPEAPIADEWVRDSGGRIVMALGHDMDQYEAHVFQELVAQCAAGMLQSMIEWCDRAGVSEWLEDKSTLQQKLAHLQDTVADEHQWQEILFTQHTNWQLRTWLHLVIDAACSVLDWLEPLRPHVRAVSATLVFRRCFVEHPETPTKLSVANAPQRLVRPDVTPMRTTTPLENLQMLLDVMRVPTNHATDGQGEMLRTDEVHRRLGRLSRVSAVIGAQRRDTVSDGAPGPSARELAELDARVLRAKDVVRQIRQTLVTAQDGSIVGGSVGRYESLTSLWQCTMPALLFTSVLPHDDPMSTSEWNRQLCYYRDTWLALAHRCVAATNCIAQMYMVLLDSLPELRNAATHTTDEGVSVPPTVPLIVPHTHVRLVTCVVKRTKHVYNNVLFDIERGTVPRGWSLACAPQAWEWRLLQRWIKQMQRDNVVLSRTARRPFIVELKRAQQNMQYVLQDKQWMALSERAAAGTFDGAEHPSDVRPLVRAHWLVKSTLILDAIVRHEDDQYTDAVASGSQQNNCIGDLFFMTGEVALAVLLHHLKNGNGDDVGRARATSATAAFVRTRPWMRLQQDPREDDSCVTHYMQQMRFSFETQQFSTGARGMCMAFARHARDAAVTQHAMALAHTYRLQSCMFATTVRTSAPHMLHLPHLGSHEKRVPGQATREASTTIKVLNWELSLATHRLAFEQQRAEQHHAAVRLKLGATRAFGVATARTLGVHFVGESPLQMLPPYQLRTVHLRKVLLNHNVLYETAAATAAPVHVDSANAKTDGAGALQILQVVCMPCPACTNRKQHLCKTKCLSSLMQHVRVNIGDAVCDTNVEVTFVWAVEDVMSDMGVVTPDLWSDQVRGTNYNGFVTSVMLESAPECHMAFHLLAR